MSRDLDWDKLDRYLAGESSPEEANEVEQWLAERPERTELAAALRDAEAGPTDVAVDAAWQRLRARMHGRETPVIPLPVSAHAERRTARTASAAGRTAARGSLLRAAAVAFVMLGAGAAWWATRPGSDAPALAIREATTLPGEQQTVSLPDGTEIVLGPGSRLRYPDTWQDSVRAVELDGGAYFRVARSPEQPFVVRAGTGEVRVLGTEFDVQAHADARGVQVVVAEGTVSLGARSAPADAAILPSATMGRLDESGAVAVVADVDVERYLAWMRGRLLFDDVSLDDVLPRLASWFGVEFRLAEPALSARRITLDMHGDSLGHVMQAIALALDVTYEVQGETVTFRPSERR